MSGVRTNSAARRRHWLCVAYAFPPINRSGTFRTLGFVRHLHHLGWDATVLTVPPGDEPFDEALLSRVPSSTEIIRAPWTDLVRQAKRWLTLGRGLTRTESSPPSPKGMVHPPTRCQAWVSRFLITPDSRLGWIGPAYRRGLAAIRRRRPDVIYSTSPYMSAHLIALRLSRRTGLPWVADFRDPWADNPYRDLEFPSIRRWDAWLERQVLRRASHVVCNTPTMLERLGRRAPNVRHKSSVILNGFDAELFSEIAPARVGPPHEFHIMHCGQFYGPRRPHPLFEACRRALTDHPELAGKLRLVLIGPSDYGGVALAELARHAGVVDFVAVLGPKSHQDTLAYMSGSDALLLIGSNGSGGDLQVPNKLYEYLAARKPIIAAVPASSPVVGILEEARAEALVCPPDNPIALAGALVRLATDRRVEIDEPWSGIHHFERAHRAKELAEVFRTLCGYGRTSRGPIISSANVPMHRLGLPMPSWDRTAEMPS